MPLASRLVTDMGLTGTTQRLSALKLPGSQFPNLKKAKISLQKLFLVEEFVALLGIFDHGSLFPCSESRTRERTMT